MAPKDISNLVKCPICRRLFTREKISDHQQSHLEDIKKLNDEIEATRDHVPEGPTDDTNNVAPEGPIQDAPLVPPLLRSGGTRGPLQPPPKEDPPQHDPPQEVKTPQPAASPQPRPEGHSQVDPQLAQFLRGLSAQVQGLSAGLNDLRSLYANLQQAPPPQADQGLGGGMGSPFGQPQYPWGMRDPAPSREMSAVLNHLQALLGEVQHQGSNFSQRIGAIEQHLQKPGTNGANAPTPPQGSTARSVLGQVQGLQVSGDSQRMRVTGRLPNALKLESFPADPRGLMLMNAVAALYPNWNIDQDFNRAYSEFLTETALAFYRGDRPARFVEVEVAASY